MPKKVKKGFCKLFADDCKLYGSVKKIEQNNLQEDLNDLSSWSDNWQLPFNVSKCKVIHHGYNNERKSYSLYGKTLESSIHERDLGVIVDNKLKFHIHTNHTSKKANQILGILKKTFKTRDATTICAFL